MTYLLLQTFLLLLAAYFLGAFLACLTKRVIGRRAVLAAAATPRSQYVAAAARPAEPQPLALPRSIEPVQPKIEIVPRPAPRTAKINSTIDTKRFERALAGPDPNEGMPRKMIVEVRPAILKSPTGPAQPLKPQAPKPQQPQPAKAPAAAAATSKPASEAAKPAVSPTPAPPTKPAESPAKPQTAEAKPAEKPAEKPPAASGPPSPAQPSGAAAATAAAAAAVAAAKAAAASVIPSAPRPVTTAPAAESVPVTPGVPSPAGPAPAQIAKQAEPAKPVAPQPQVTTGGDDLQRIRAIDADTERKLRGAGVSRFDHIARWTAEDISRVNEALGLAGRIEREQWIEQAQILAKGGDTYYSRNRAAATRSAQAVAPPTTGDPPRKTESAPASPAQAPKAPSASAMPSPTAAPVQPQSAPAVVPQPTPAKAAAEAAPAPITAPVKSVVPDPAPAKPAATTTPADTSSVKPQQSQASSAQPAPAPTKSVAEMATAAAAAIAAASASVTRGIRPIEPISPLSKVDRNVSMPAKLSDAIKGNETKPLATPIAAKDATTPRSPRDGAKADDLKRIRGIGVLIEKRLNGLGIYSYNDIANWTIGDIDRISQTLDFKGRIERESWVEQARILSSGGHTEFSRRVDRGDVESSRDPEDT